jgi:hypothetical protein
MSTYPNKPRHLIVEVLPIDMAPIKPGEYFEPCLLTPGAGDEWTTGRWNGWEWADDDGNVLTPTAFALLPRRTTVSPWTYQAADEDEEMPSPRN